jgi:Zn-dependent M28 family amino/carboxypeptidase
MAASELEILREALREHVNALAVEIGPRTPSDPNSLVRAANYIHSVFADAGLSVREQDYQYCDQRVTNVLATVPATTDASSYYVVGAHYDTIPGTPGADDNASAVAVMLELAGRLRQPNLKAPVLFAAFTLEEPPAHWTGHQGSRVFVRSCQSKGDRVLGAIILEMVGYTAPRQHYPFLPRWPGYPAEGNFIGIIGNSRSWRFGRAAVRGFRQNRDLPVESLFLPFDGWILPETRLSDHASFWDAGLPALMITDTAFFRNPNYHRPSDTIDTLDFTFMAQLVKSLELALLELPPVPNAPAELTAQGRFNQNAS